MDPRQRHRVVKTWTKSVSLFPKEFLWFTINVGNTHWYGICFVRPYLVGNSKNQAGTLLMDKDNNFPCILIFDSMCSHKTLSYYRKDLMILKDYMVCEWMSKGFSTSQLIEKGINYENEKEKWAYVPAILLESPQQRNGFDCGFYTIRNFKNILCFKPTSTKQVIQSNFKDFLVASHYTRDDIAEDRTTLQVVVQSLITDYQKLKHQPSEKFLVWTYR